MSNKQYLKPISVSLISLIIGVASGAALALFIYGMARDHVNVYLQTTTSYLSDLDKRTYQAYKHEKPETAIWALTNFIEIQEQHRDFLDEVIKKQDGASRLQLERKLVQHGLIKCNVLLALKYREINDLTSFDNVLATALDMANSESKVPVTKADILNYFDPSSHENSN